MVYYIAEDFLKDKQYVLNKFCTYKFDENHILLTTDHGSWSVLSNDEHDLLLKNRVEENLHLFKILENRGIIITEKNCKDIGEVYKQRFDYLSNGIGLHIVAPTLRCNHNCVYCHSNSKEMTSKSCDMDEDVAKSVVDFIFQTPAKSITIEFQGGEPLALFHIVEYIIEYSKRKNNSNHCEKGWWIGDKNINFVIVTNLTLMDDDILRYLLDNKIRISTSLDGPKELHDKNRPYRNGRGSYDDVVHWIGVIKEKHPEMNALPTITKFSLNYAKEIADEYVKNKFTHTRMRELNIAGMAIEAWNKIGYTSEEFIRFWKEYLEYVISLNNKNSRFWDETTHFVLRRILCSKSTLNACLNSPCGVGTIQCAYNHNGDVYTCDEARSDETFKIGNVKERNYNEIFTSKNVSSFVSLSSCLSFSCDNCVWHPYCSPCLVSTYGEQKSLVPKFPNFICKIRGEQTKEVFRRLIFPKDRDIVSKWLMKSG